MTQEQTSQPAERIECPATREGAVRMFILAGLLAAVAIWCVLDWGKFPKPDEPLGFPNFNKYAGFWFNHYGPFVLVPLAGLAFLRGRKLLRRVLVADSAGIGYAGGPQIAWSSVTLLDTSVFAEKQILYLVHDNGKRFTLDALAFKRFKELVAFVEAHVPPEARPSDGQPQNP